jgi:hypothetical protein
MFKMKGADNQKGAAMKKARTGRVSAPFSFAPF